MTRAERTVLLSGHHWGRTGSKPHGPSEFLLEVRDAAAGWCAADEWAPAPGDGEMNPLTAEPRTNAVAAGSAGQSPSGGRTGGRLVEQALVRSRLRRSGWIPGA